MMRLKTLASGPRHPFPIGPSALLLGLAAAVGLAVPGGLLAQEAIPSPGDSLSLWPMEVETERIIVTLYQPQPDRFEGNLLEGRMVVSVVGSAAADAEPVFGTVWFEARIDTDRDDRTGRVRDMEVVRTHFPDLEAAQASQFAAGLTEWMSGQVMELDLDLLMTSIADANRRDIAVEGLSMTPPEILYRNQAAVLVMIDGDPILERVGEDVMAVVNSAFAILYDMSATRYYLFAGEDLWYWSREVMGPWAFTATVPSSIKEMIPPPGEEEREALMGAPEELPSDPGAPPEIVVTTVPTELIATLGEAQFTPISGTDLMFVGNTESDLFMHPPTGEYYVLLSGRWFQSQQLDRGWIFVESADLPESFRAIPADSETGSIRAHVAGTEEADEAVLDAQIPQTAAIRRDDASLVVEFDGDPQFEAIEGMSLSYAINTALPVIHAGTRYYAVSEGVWYSAGETGGPWQVATAVPEEIYDIPPQSPVYNVTYVEIFQTTPEYVYVGYYPGYTGSYVHHTTVVYGTGYYYPYWWGGAYYPGPATWGWHVRWNPWTGWTMGMTWSNGWFTFGIGYSPWRPWCCYGGFWGPGPYHRGYYAGRRAGYHAGYRAGFRAGYRAGQANLYRQPGVAARNATPAQLDRSRPAQPANRPQARPSTGQNNVFADRDGNVHRRTDRGWESRDRGGWNSSGPGTGGTGQRPQTQPARPQTRPSQPQTQPTRPQTRPNQPQTQPARPQYGAQPSTRQQDLNRSQQQRDRGAQRSQQYRQSRPPARSAPRATPRRRGDV